MPETASARRGRNHDIKLAVGHAGDHVVAGPGRQAKVAVAQVLGERNHQFRRDLGIEVVDHADRRLVRWENIQNGQFRLRLADTAERVAGAVQKDAARGASVATAGGCDPAADSPASSQGSKAAASGRQAEPHQPRPFGHVPDCATASNSSNARRVMPLASMPSGTPFRRHSFQKVELAAGAGHALAVI